MARPTTDSLDVMFDALIKSITAKLASEDCPASVLKEARELLKDNGIEATELGLNKLKAVDNLLPFAHENLSDS